MSDKVIKEHYVPQRYLRYFAAQDKFFVYDKEKKETRPGNVSNYACERFFYDVDFGSLKQEIREKEPDFEFDSEIETFIASVDEQHIEHWFGKNVETWLFNPIARLITTYTMCNPEKLNTISVLSEDEMNYIALYIAVQFIRSKEFRESMTELYERLPLLLLKKFAKTNEEKCIIDNLKIKIANENHKKIYHAQFLTDPDIAADLSTAFRNKIWCIGYNQTNIPFFTSDNPIVRFGHEGKCGFSSRGIEICFPLTTKLILIIKDPIYFWYEQELHNHFVEVDENDVTFFNSLQVQQSYRYIFNKTSDFSLVDGMMKRNPALSNIKHQRFLMG